MKQQTVAGRVALAALLAALSLGILYSACVAPAGRLGLVAVAGLMPAAAVISAGPRAGGLCYGGTGLLALFLLPDKGNALLYLLLFGLYPLVKYGIERLRRLVLELVLKLVFFNGVLTLLWCALRPVLLSAVPVPEGMAWLLYLGGSIVFLCYDFGFTKLIGFYVQRVDRPLRKGRG